MTTVLLFIPTSFENQSLTSSMLYEKGRVIEVDNSYLNSFSVVTTGTQEVTTVVKSGKFKGDTLKSQNTLIGQKSIDKIFYEGDMVLLILQLNETKEHVIGARASEFYRQGIEAILFVCFALFLVLFAKMVGLKALLSFVFTALAFWKLLIPMYLKGYSPLLGAIFIVFITSVVIILLVGGLNKKGLVSLLGTMAGVVVTAILAVVFGRLMKIPGTVQEYSEALLYES